MDNDSTSNITENSPVTAGFNPTLAIVLVVVALVGGYFIFKRSSANFVATPNPTPNETTTLGTTSTSSLDVQTFNVEGGMFYYKPNEIKVKVNSPVRIVFSNKEGFHDFIIDEFKVKSDRIAANKEAVVEFTPDKVGTFDYYCSVGTHRAQGMWGKLIVEQ